MPTRPIRTTEDFNPGHARWCPEHTRLECTAQRRKNRGQCHQLARKGTDKCRTHAGYSGNIHRAQGQARISAWSPVGTGAKMDAGVAVLSVLQMSWLRLAAYSALLQRQVTQSPEEPGNPVTEDEPQASGLIGFRYGAAGKDGSIYVQSEEVRALVALEAAERDRVVRYAKTAHDMGISDRLTSLAERWGDVVAGRIAVMLEALVLTPEQAALVPGLLQKHLGTIDIDASDVIEHESSS